MLVTPIAHTVFGPGYARKSTFPESVQETAFAGRSDMAGDYYGRGLNPETHDDNLTDIDLLGEFAGRSCYQAWNMPNPATANNEGYLRNIIDQGHFSVLEHGSVTFYVEGVSRSLTHELIRHRHLSYSELSQRYVNMTEADFVIPPVMREHGEEGSEAKDKNQVPVKLVMPDAIDQYEEIVAFLEEKGVTGKKAREAARSVMPGATETKIVVTGNLRAWRDMLHKRWHVAADAEIREFAGLVLDHLREIAPHSVQDMPEAPFQ